MSKPKVIALTFDDGPNAVTTPDVLEKLKKYSIKASFFLVGNNITEQSAQYVKAAHDMGCEINNHSRTHSAMPNLAAEEMRAEIAYTSEKIIQITGEPPLFFRPPYIAISESMYENIDLPFIAGIGAEDWLDEVSAEERAKRILAQAQDGDIILLHDMQGNFRTVQALDKIIPELIARGFELVTVSELFKAHGVKPRSGVTYTNVLSEALSGRG